MEEKRKETAAGACETPATEKTPGDGVKNSTSPVQAGAGGSPKKPKKANPTKRKIIALVLFVGAVLLALATVLIVNAVRNRRPPDLEEIRARVESLITESRAVNEIFFGEGLPSYERVTMPDYVLGKYTYTFEGKEYNRSYYTFTDRDGRNILKYQYCIAAGTDQNGDGKADYYQYPDLEFGGFLTVEYVNNYRYAEVFTTPREDAFHTLTKEGEDGETQSFWYVKLHDYTEPFYYTAEDDPNYDYIREDCPYQSIDDIKALAEKVYSAEYLASVYESLFTGITVSDRYSGTMLARYSEVTMEDGFIYLMKSNKIAPVPVDRVYDFSTMRMVKPSRSNYVNLEIETFTERDPSVRVTVRVSLKYENGNWFLDSPTY